ncbi:MAG: MFS transporter [Acidobacteria bacterium]|nr:MFS transporter [Acidobacteriota bacterium]
MTNPTVQEENLTPIESGTNRPRLPGAMAVLSFRNYRLFWIGTFLANIGNWMQSVALGWVVLELTDSTFFLGLQAFAASMPSLVFVLVGGVIADQHDRKRLMQATQLTASLLALALGLLTTFGFLRIWQIILISLFAGTAAALYAPTNQAVLPDLVPPEKIAYAIAFNSVQFNVSRIIGPALAGFFLVNLDAASCFFLNALSLLSLVFMLTRIVIPAPGAGARRHSEWEQFKSGLNCFYECKEIMAVTLLVGAESFFVLSFTSMLPVFARDVLASGLNGFSRLTGSMGLGALLGAVFFLKTVRRRRKGRLMVSSLMCFYAAIFLLALSRTYYVSLVAMAIAGFFMATANSTMTDFVQKLSPPEYRARIMGIYITASLGSVPVGSLLVGLLAEFIGVQWSVASFAVLAAVSTYLVVRYLPEVLEYK